jgi:hypothetical protein
MPNIKLYGHSTRSAKAVTVREQIWELMYKSFPKLRNDAVFTVVDSTVSDNMYVDQPYIEVSSSTPGEAEEIARAIHEELNMDVEWFDLGGFFAKNIAKAG